MAEHSTIEWTDATWNPLTGCTPVGAGCRNCYAARLAGTRLKYHRSRYGLTKLTEDGRHVWTGEVRFNPEALNQLRHWRAPRRVFVCAHSDLFHEAVDAKTLLMIFRAMQDAPQHCYQVLTKRPERMARDADELDRRGYLPPHIWFGCSASNQAELNAGMPPLLLCPGRRFLSLEPLLGPICTAYDAWRFLDLVIAGGESGPGARPSHPNWFRSLRGQCEAAGVPFMFKQWGEWRPPVSGELYNTAAGMSPSRGCPPAFIVALDGTAHCYHKDYAHGRGLPMLRVGKRAAGRLLDGREHNWEVDWWA